MLVLMRRILICEQYLKKGIDFHISTQFDMRTFQQGKQWARFFFHSILTLNDNLEVLKNI